MKKLLYVLCLLSALICFSACASNTLPDKNGGIMETDSTAEAVTDNTFIEEPESSPSYTMIYKDDGSSEIIYNSAPTPIIEYNFGDRKYDEEVVICDPYLLSNQQIGLVDYAKLSDSVKIDCSAMNFLSGESLLKILAGDSDVDIYILHATDVKKLLDAEIYACIDSEKIKSFNSKCFDYISSFTVDKSGNTFIMPVLSSVNGLVYSDETAAETGFTRNDLLYYDTMIDFLKNYKGNRKAYSNGMNFFWDLESQYEFFYCDFENKNFDYMTDTYKKIYSILEGWKRYGPEPHPVYFANDFRVSFIKNSDQILFYEQLLNRLMHSAYTEINGTKNQISMGFESESALDDMLTIEEIGELRVAPMPKIDETIDKNCVSVTFAYINPYSKNKENAVKVLEELAANYFNYSGVYPYTYMFKEKDVYPDNYLTDSQLFADAYEICSNGYINPYQVPTLHNDIEEFQNGRATLEEAIAMYQREVNIWLNE